MRQQSIESKSSRSCQRYGRQAEHTKDTNWKEGHREYQWSSSSDTRGKVICPGEFKEELKPRGIEDLQVRDGGGKDIVLTFESVESMKDKLAIMDG